MSSAPHDFDNAFARTQYGPPLGCISRSLLELMARDLRSLFGERTHGSQSQTNEIPSGAPWSGRNYRQASAAPFAGIVPHPIALPFAAHDPAHAQTNFRGFQGPARRSFPGENNAPS